jgi:thiol:disulfide interchange protein DsbA
MKRAFLFSFVLFLFINLVNATQIQSNTASDEVKLNVYGTGPILVRMYSDYFCPPCRSIEKEVETIIEELVKKGIIRVCFIDAPIHKLTPFYVRYFLYAVKDNNDLRYALFVRKALFEAAGNRIEQKEDLEAFLTSRGISFVVFNVKPYLEKMNLILQEDKINATPTCVVIDGKRSEKVSGKEEIINLLKRLKEGKGNFK